MLFGRKKKNPIKIADKKVKEWKYTTCGYCSTGCSMEVGLNPSAVASAANSLTGSGSDIHVWSSEILGARSRSSMVMVYA